MLAVFGRRGTRPPSSRHSATVTVAFGHRHRGIRLPSSRHSATVGAGFISVLSATSKIQYKCFAADRAGMNSAPNVCICNILTINVLTFIHTVTLMSFADGHLIRNHDYLPATTLSAAKERNHDYLPATTLSAAKERNRDYLPATTLSAA